ncbi:amidophosphoribosyltransferase [Arcanobacterium pluranimalium]|uniref:amidophosphoribosyltransferase n=1 Tax=Arcanobacterium pluranimalium TaxID=108028 RepID=UPI00195C8F71|nr:amidophosphoribosyltransferase [Arcanobacterium pluranimalium]MBM7825033.1 amidophosphoribosyltransferase [Arcanobacterium pluranimalium]
MNGDGRLSHVLDPSDKGQDECGVFGVWAPGKEVAHLAYFGLYALQHRGQEAAGIATSNGENILIYKDIGLVSQVFHEKALASLDGHLAIGHVRYATTGQGSWVNAQPTLGATEFGTIALAHNGNLVNAPELIAQVQEISGADLRGEIGHGSSTDTAVVTALLGATRGKASIEDVAMDTLPLLKGAFSLVFMDEQKLYAARDPQGFRPLVLGSLDDGWVVASETAALDIVGAKFEREIAPGEFVVIDGDGVRSRTFAASKPRGCAFEYVYLSRPDTVISGRNINSVRNEMGRILAREHKVDADIVIATPDSGTPAAIGYAQESGIPYAQGLVKNAYVGRTFIQPTQEMRQRGIRLKLNPLREVIQGQRIVVVDDSIVRGNTQYALVKTLREAGAAQVHVRISSPPVQWPCFFGIDFPTRAELIANSLNLEQICEQIGADSLGYLSHEGMVRAIGLPVDKLCFACFNGDYPIPVDVHTARISGC